MRSMESSTWGWSQDRRYEYSGYRIEAKRGCLSGSLGISEQRIHQIVVRKTMERARLELLAANEIGLVRIDTERVTIGVDPRR